MIIKSWLLLPSICDGRRLRMICRESVSGNRSETWGWARGLGNTLLKAEVFLPPLLSSLVFSIHEILWTLSLRPLHWSRRHRIEHWYLVVGERQQSKDVGSYETGPNTIQYRYLIDTKSIMAKPDWSLNITRRLRRFMSAKNPGPSLQAKGYLSV